MAKSPSEQIRDLTAQVGVLAERIATRERDAEELSRALRHEVEERRSDNEKRREEATGIRRELAELRQENAVLRQQLQDHLKQVELWDGRRWSLIVLLFGTVLSLASGLIVTLARR